MADARTQHELRCLKIDTKEDHLEVQHGGRQLRRRVGPSHTTTMSLKCSYRAYRKCTSTYK